MKTITINPTRERSVLWLEKFVKTRKANANHWKTIQDQKNDIESHIELPRDLYLKPRHFVTPATAPNPQSSKQILHVVKIACEIE